MNEKIREGFEWQIVACRSLGSPLTSGVLAGVLAAADETTRTGRRILDWPGDPKLDAMMLRIAGGLNALARSGQECIERFEEDHYDLILMDVQMPGMDGLEATLRIRQTARGAHVPIIALTALAMPGDYQRCIDAGMNDYVTKPLPLRKLKKMIADYLGLGD